MPLTYRIDPEQRIVTITGDYAVAEEWRAMLGSVVRHPDFRPGCNFIRDLRNSVHPVSAEAVIAADEHIPLRAFTSYDEAVRWLREE